MYNESVTASKGFIALNLFKSESSKVLVSRKIIEKTSKGVKNLLIEITAMNRENGREYLSPFFAYTC